MCRTNFCVLPIVVAIILGVVIGALFFTGTIVAGIVAVPIAIALIFAIITIILLFNTVAFGIRKETRECICDYGRCLAIGAFVTLVAGVLAITFVTLLAAGSIISALLIGVLAFGLILNFLSFVGFIVCLIRYNCYRRNDDCIL